MIELTRRYRFSASHRLHAPVLSAEENEELYGKCNHPFGHGHDYQLEVTVRGPVDPGTGVLIPPSVLDELVGQHILRLFASRNINVEVPYFATLVPTTENIVSVITEILQGAWHEYISDRVSLRRVYVRETGRNGFEILIAQKASFLTDKVLVDAESVHAESIHAEGEDV